ncbi:hypothetical protein AYI68_g574 [Smittium mucronatum]|uniref:Calcipressin-like protein n=1 Tax=Smittium mucronatum TaxID=133383 RepID=A0A1R0H7X3_9FUNG|nr:hypothetical protein AYI68_g574 [Smittium mucronatum]
MVSLDSHPTNSLVVIFTKYNDNCANLLLEKLKLCLVVYNTKYDAETAKKNLEGFEIEPGNFLKLYFSMNTDFKTIQDNFLAVPESEKLQLISPPGSPILGWTQQPEDCPNKVFMDNSLLSALEELKDGVYALDMDDVVSVASFDCDFSLDSQAARLAQDFPSDFEPLDSLQSDGFSSDSTPLSPSIPPTFSSHNKTFVPNKSVPTFIIEDFDKSRLDEKYSLPIIDRCPTPLPKTPAPPSNTI